MNSPDLSKSPNRRRRTESAAERVQAEVQREEVRQLNVAIPVESSPGDAYACPPGGHHPAGIVSAGL